VSLLPVLAMSSEHFYICLKLFYALRIVFVTNEHHIQISKLVIEVYKTWPL
jgi:hypothetical protein